MKTIPKRARTGHWVIQLPSY